MKEAFKKCMRHLYPKGVGDPSQLGDLVKTFVMGWIEGLDSVNCEPEKWDIETAAKMTDPDWRPDTSWRWW